ncbi:MAG: hypothetical protein V3U13_05190 [Gemmatimonadota bacterium]|jgi:hypothetical protein
MKLNGTQKVIAGVAVVAVVVAAATLFSTPAPAGPAVTVYKTPT